MSAPPGASPSRAIRVLAAEPEPEMRTILGAEIAEHIKIPVEGVVLRLRSVRGSIEGQTRPGPEAVISIVSRSAEIRYGSRSMLIAVGLDPECLCEVDAASPGWQERLRLSTLVITDVVTARELPSGCPARVFRVIADASIAELKQFCGAS